MALRAYLDWNPTSPLRPAAREAMAAAFDVCGNPSSVHAEGRAARRLIEDARDAVAEATGAEARNVVFTSGGTEANTLALGPGLQAADGQSLRRLVVSAIEHPSVLAGGRFDPADVRRTPVDSQGVVDLEALRMMLIDQPPALVSVMLANNETGALQPIREVAELVHAAGGLLHVDAVQGLGRIRLDISELHADLMTVSSHKVGGPKGVGALVLGDAVEHIEAAIRGGGQERGRRAGTENVAGIAGFGVATRVAVSELEQQSRRLLALRDRLEAELRAIDPAAMIFAEGTARLPNTTLFSAPGLKAETAVIAFDLEGVAVSSGAACSSGKVQPSHVLAAMGVPAALAGGAVRVSLGWNTSETEVNRCLEAWRMLAEVLVRKGKKH